MPNYGGEFMGDDIAMETVREVLEELHRLHKSCYELKAIAVKKHQIDISPEQAKLLFMIYHGKFTNQNDLAKKLRITPATLSVRIQRLETAGYLRREVDVHDKRNYILAVESKGQELIAISHQVMDTVMQRLLDGFSKEDVQQLLYFIDTMKYNIKDIKEEI